MSERFYLPVPLRGVVSLDGPEAHHLAHVLRNGPGDEVVLFDGSGTEADARIDSVSKRAVSLTVLRARTTEPDAAPRLILATAVPKGDRFRWLVEKATELGVDRLVPLETERSVVDPRETKLDKMRQAVVAACKQCGRNRLMEIAPTVRFAALVKDAVAGGTLLLADRSGRPLAEVMAGRERIAGSITAAVGPEGGWTPEEVELAGGAGGLAVSVAPWILRIETAALAVAAAALSGNRT